MGGFTLIELMITITIAVVLLAIALPNFREMMMRMNVSANTNDLILALSTARAESVRRGVPVAVIADGSGWTGGWSIRVDSIGSPGTFPTLLQRHEAVAKNYSVTATATGVVAGLVPATSNSQVVFSGDGSLRGATSMDINVCRPSFASDAHLSNWINVTGSGAASSAKDTTVANDKAPSC